MNAAVRSVAVTHPFSRLFVAVSVLGAALLLPIGFAGVAGADRPQLSPAPGNESTTPSAAANESVQVSYVGDAVVHEDEFVYAWRRNSLDVRVHLDQTVRGDQVCLYRSNLDETSTLVSCSQIRTVNTDRTLTFRNVGYGVDGPVVFQISVQVRDDSNRVLVQTRSKRIVQITNWSDIDEDHFSDYAERAGLVNMTDAPGHSADRTEPNGAERTTNTTEEGRNRNENRSIPVENASKANDVGGRLTIFDLQDAPQGLSSLLVLLLGVGGLLALVALLYVQRRSDSEKSEYGAYSTSAGDADGQGRAESDPELVVQLLAENGGRLKQSDIVEATDWSKAKVSRLLSRMADRGYIDKRQDGRQNQIILRQHD